MNVVQKSIIYSSELQEFQNLRDARLQGSILVKHTAFSLDTMLKM